MFSHIGAALSFYFGGKTIDKYGSFRILNFEIVFNRIVNLVALFFPNILSPLLMSSSSWTFGVGSVALNSLLQKEFTERQRATMGSINSLAGSIAFGIASFVLGSMADSFGTTKALIFTHILLLTPLFFYWKVFKQKV